MEECIVCFDELKQGTGLKCCNHLCGARICSDCLGLMIKYSCESNVLPICPDSKCKSYYLFSEIKKIPYQPTNSLINPLLLDAPLNLYSRACLQYIIREKGDVASKEIQQQKILEKLREERIQYLNTNFPIAIAKVANIALKTKLRALEKNNKLAIQEKLQLSYKKCMNLYCIGKLDAANACLLCLTKFCIKCEKVIPAGTTVHTCKPEDLESMDFIKSLIKCPECNVPVQKSDGCDSITCSNCSTNFNYKTGTKGGHGSNNAKIVMKERTKLSLDLKDSLQYQEYNMLLKIEAKEPPLKTDKSLINSVKQYYELRSALAEGEELDQAITTKLALTAAKGLEFLVLNQIKTKKFYNALAEIEQLNQNKQLTLDKLKQIYAKFD